MQPHADRYGGLAVTLHWLSALAVFVLLGSGFAAAWASDAAAKVALLQLHVPLAIALLVLTLVRIGWRVFKRSAPPSLAGTPRWQAATARAVHLLLYLALLLMLGSGIALLITSGAGPVVFGGTGVLPDLTRFAPHTGHVLGALAILALLAAHIGAVLYHHLVARENILRRMWYQRAR